MLDVWREDYTFRAAAEALLSFGNGYSRHDAALLPSPSLLSVSLSPFFVDPLPSTTQN